MENDLGSVLEDRFAGISDEVLPVFDIREGRRCLIARRSYSSDVRFMHFVAYEEGAPVAVIGAHVQAASIDPSEQDPDGVNEYILSQLFCLVWQNHVIWATHNEPLREGRIEDIFSSFILSNGGTNEETQFGFQVILDQAVVQAALEQGIQEIDLGVGEFRATLERVTQGGILDDHSIMAKLAHLFHGPASQEDLDAASDIEGTLILRPGRAWDKPDVKDLMVTMSNNVRENYDEEFAIVTKTGLRLTRDRMSLKRDCDVQGNRRVVSSVQMEHAMRELFHQLRENHVIDTE